MATTSKKTAPLRLAARPERPPSRMKVVRIHRGISQLELAVMVGISANYMSILERAPSQMTGDVAERVAKALGVGVDEIKG